MDVSVLALPAFLIWLIMLTLPWRPWDTQESLDADPLCKHNLYDVTVLIPACNEAEVVATLTGKTDIMRYRSKVDFCNFAH